jgi:glycerol uptake facilitator protein
MNPYVAEAIGTALLILLGNGVVANVVLVRTKGNSSGWIVITFGWAMAVMVGAYTAAPFSGAHLNPALTLSLASIGLFPWAQVPGYIAAQMTGAFLGSVAVCLAYLPHWSLTPDGPSKLACFSTAPAVRMPAANFVTEFIGTFVLVFGILAVPSSRNMVIGSGPGVLSAGFFGIYLVALIVLSIGLSLGGPTGYAINPARDLGPRIAHAILPIPGKGPSDWGYAWIPVAGPCCGGVAAAVAYSAFFPK